MKTLVVVDCQNDFITGSLACENDENAVDNIVKFINNSKEMLRVVYSADWHTPKHCSFSCNGGTWPIHCVQQSEGADIYEGFYDFEVTEQEPLEDNVFMKGDNDNVEEYSAYDARNTFGEVLNECVTDDVIVCGIACEFCVKNTIDDFIRNGFKVSIFKDGIAWVNKNDSDTILKEYENRGVAII